MSRGGCEVSLGVSCEFGAGHGQGAAPAPVLQE